MNSGKDDFRHLWKNTDKMDRQVFPEEVREFFEVPPIGFRQDYLRDPGALGGDDLGIIARLPMAASGFTAGPASFGGPL